MTNQLPLGSCAPDQGKDELTHRPVKQSWDMDYSRPPLTEDIPECPISNRQRTQRTRLMDVQEAQHTPLLRYFNFTCESSPQPGSCNFLIYSYQRSNGWQPEVIQHIPPLRASFFTTQKAERYRRDITEQRFPLCVFVHDALVTCSSLFIK